ncbi:MAG: pyrroline-5-carboxylate reductase [Clostridia bacterium]|nr:pyrroline-5-carboxylate reductase [Clostridia bacterium]
MNQTIRLAFIGAGNMSSAMIGGLCKSEDSPFSIGLASRTKEKCEPFRAMGVTVFDSNTEALAWADMIVLGIKPQQYETVLSEFREAGLPDRRIVFVSIAAGITTDAVCRMVGADVPVVRAMPNTPMLLGLGSTAVSRNARVTDEEYESAEKIFSASGMVIDLPEDKMNAVIAATGSSPAYLYLIIKAIYDEARAQGVDAPTLLDGICQMTAGAAQMIRDSGDDPETLIRRVCSPGGTTEQAMRVLYDEDLPGILARAMQACTKRAEELGAMYQ